MTGVERRPGIVARLLGGAVRGYQLIVSPWFAPTCRYYPSCSAYALESLRVHGAAKGSVLTVWRLLRCNPWSRGGIDHVPPHGAWPSDSDRVPRPVDGGPPLSTDHMPDHATGRAAEGRTLGSRTSRRARA